MSKDTHTPDVLTRACTRARKCTLAGRDIQACTRLDTHIHLHAEACVFTQ